MKLLIYDDNEDELKLIKRALKGMFFDIETVTSRDGFFNKLEQYEFDLYLIDQNLEDKIRGIDIVRECQKTIDKPFVLITAQRDTHLLEEAFAVGMSDFISKPFNITVLRKKIEKVLETHSYKLNERRVFHETTKQLIVAKGLINELMPPRLKVDNDLFINWHTHSYNKLGGDFVFYSKTNMHQNVFVVGDISGHDIRSALLISAFYTAFESSLKSPFVSLDDLVNKINNKLYDKVLNNDFICLVIGIYDEENKTIFYMNLGMRSPLLFHSINNSYEVLNDVGDLPLGWKTSAYEEKTVQRLNFLPGDLFICCSDGFFEEAYSNSMLKSADIENKIKNIVDDANSFNMSQKLMECFKSRNCDFHDDSTIMTIGQMAPQNQFYYRGELILEQLSSVCRIISAKVLEMTSSENMSAKIEVILSELLSNLIKHSSSSGEQFDLCLDSTKELRVFILRKKQLVEFEFKKQEFKLPKAYSSNGYGLYLIKSLTSNIEEFNSGDYYVTSFAL